jgi:hypothetical protein
VNAESISPVVPEPAVDSPPVFPLKENGKSTGQWTLTIHPSHLALADAPGAQPYVILRGQFMKPVMFMEGLRAIAVETPRRTIFKLPPEGAGALADWLGKPFLAAFYLKRRYAWVLPWAFLWVMGSVITLMPSPRSGISPHFDVTSFVLGSVLLVCCMFAKWRPHPVLFLVDSFWFATIAINLTVSVIFGHSKGWLVLVALMVWMTVTGFKHYFRFRGTKIQPPPK